MNWGYKIAIFYTAFAVFILTLVVKSMNQRYDLVADDYYEKELKFQDRIDKENLVAAEHKQVTWQVDEHNLNLVFPATGGISGEIKLFRPSNASMDISVPVKKGADGKQQIDISKAGKGKYLLQVDWKENGKSYFQEDIIIL